MVLFNPKTMLFENPCQGNQADLSNQSMPVQIDNKILNATKTNDFNWVSINLPHHPDRSEPINIPDKNNTFWKARKNLPYLPIKSARPIKTYQHILYQSIPDEKTESESNLTLTLSTYPISQTDQNLLTHHHQPDYTNPF